MHVGNVHVCCIFMCAHTIVSVRAIGWQTAQRMTGDHATKIEMSSSAGGWEAEGQGGERQEARSDDYIAAAPVTSH